MNITKPVTFGAVVIPKAGNEALFENKAQLVPNRAAGFHTLKHGPGKNDIDALVITTRDDLSPLGKTYASVATDTDVRMMLARKFPTLQGVRLEPLAKLELFQHSVHLPRFLGL